MIYDCFCRSVTIVAQKQPIPGQMPKQTPNVDKEADLKVSTPSSTESPSQGSDAEEM